MPDANQTDTTREDALALQKDLVRIAHMFEEHREDEIMRELCRLAVKFAQERLIRD